MARDFALTFLFTAENDADADNFGAEGFEALLALADANNIAFSHFGPNCIIIPDAEEFTPEQVAAHAAFLGE